MTATGTWWAEHAWLGGDTNASGVIMEVEGGAFSSVTAGVPHPPAGAVRLEGVTLPGFANAHSHAFHRSLRGRANDAGGTFWTWRRLMYSVAARLDPESYRRLAAAVYAEMALSGYTTVGEFHYLHHAPGGRRYSDPNEMGHALAEAAAEAGVRLTLLDTCYLAGGFGVGLEEDQLRFSDGDADAWAERTSLLRAGGRVRLGAAIHSVRAVPPASAAVVAAVAAERRWPLHAHVAEQEREVEECFAATGRTPVEVLDEAGAIGEEFTAVHATHVSEAGVGRLGAARARVCACPSTEADLGDGIGPFDVLRSAGTRICLGSDSHASIDPFEEMRGLESGARLSSGRRGVMTPAELLSAATESGMASLGWPEGGRIDAGALADFVTLDAGSVTAAGCDPRSAATQVFAACAGAVTHVVVGGNPVVEGGRHVRSPDLAKDLGEAIRGVLA